MTDYLAQRRRGYLASRRMTPLGPCGCIRHPEVDKHRCTSGVSDLQADAAAAIKHLDGAGVAGLLDTDTCQAMWRVGHHELAVEVHHRTAGWAA